MTTTGTDHTHNWSTWHWRTFMQPMEVLSRWANHILASCQFWWCTAMYL